MSNNPKAPRNANPKGTPTPAPIAASFEEEEVPGEADEVAVEVAVTVMVVVEAAAVSFGFVDPEVRLLITRPVGTWKGLLLPRKALSHVRFTESPVPQQKSFVVKGHMSCPLSILA